MNIMIHSLHVQVTSFLRKDGSEVQVLDHGRIVNNSYYGRVFYVLMSNVEQLKDHFPEI